VNAVQEVGITAVGTVTAVGTITTVDTVSTVGTMTTAVRIIHTVASVTVDGRR
jgi:hypothetical protein